METFTIFFYVMLMVCIAAYALVYLAKMISVLEFMDKGDRNCKKCKGFGLTYGVIKGWDKCECLKRENNARR
jgi:hypothetical protein